MSHANCGIVLAPCSVVASPRTIVLKQRTGCVGGAGPRLAERYEEEAKRVKALHGSYLLRLGELRVGRARHRALLFKVTNEKNMPLEC
jgi:hypothetical protein